jgi:hypothetical protein
LTFAVGRGTVTTATQSDDRFLSKGAGVSEQQNSSMVQSSLVSVHEGQDEGYPCLVIETPSATYSYQTAAGGFSSIVDRDGIDWIGFAPGRAHGRIGAANVYRGLPNAVWPDNIGHPGYHRCSSHWTVHEDRAVIHTESDDGAWAWNWAITAHAAEFAMCRAPDDRKYWFLYEGVIGGSYDPAACYWGSPRHGRSQESPQLLDANGADCVREPFQWAYFGANRVPRVFYLVRTSVGDEPGLLAYMGADNEGSDGMMVFGFGRGPGPEPLLSGENSFVIGFLESTQHDEISAYLEGRMQQLQERNEN